MKEIELEDWYSKNDRYLVEEYLKHGTDDFLLAGLHDKTFVVPYKYRVNAKNEKDAIALFKSVLLDFQKAEADNYLKNGLNVRTEVFEGITYVVPYSARELQTVFPERLAQYVAGQAEVKYNRIIEMHSELVARGYSVGDVDVSSAAMSKYTHYLEQIYEKEARQADEVAQVAAKAKGRKSKKFGITAKEIMRQAGKIATNLWEKGKKAPKTVAASAVLGATVLGLHFLPEKSAEEQKDDVNKVKTEIAPVEVKDNKPRVFRDFTGRRYLDSFGNIARIMELKPEISAMLIALEGYAGKVYDDGKGKLTIGSGTTFYLDDDGKPQDVKAGDRTTPEKAMKDKWRFIEKELIKYLGDKVGRKCSDEELICCIGAAYCWGGTNFSNSEYYKSVKKGEPLSVQARKLTGFRQDKGHLKRYYLMAALLQGQWTPKDLLDMPIYWKSGKGYLISAIYNLKLGEIMPCKKNKKGKFIKDENGNHIPVVEKDGFCTFYDNTAEIKEQIFDTKNTKKSFKCVREFMPKEMLQKIEQKEATNNDVSMMFIKYMDQGRL